MVSLDTGSLYICTYALVCMTNCLWVDVSSVPSSLQSDLALTLSAAVLKGSSTTAFVYHLSSSRPTSCSRELQPLAKLPNLFLANEDLVVSIILL